MAKLLKYIKYDRCAQVVFGIFAFLFLIARLVVYPWFLLWSVLFEYPVVISHSPAWWIMVILLFVLQVRRLGLYGQYVITLHVIGNAHLLVYSDLSNDQEDGGR